MTKSPNILGIIGDPISHSLSPLMQNAGLSALKLPYLYIPFHIKDKEVKKFFQTLTKKDIRGFNVTIPHKTAVIPYLSSLSKEAKLIGAVNTVVVKGNKTIGYNTDGRGYIRSLKIEAKYDVKGKKVVLLGAGGSARAIAVALGLAGAKNIYIVNRTNQKAIDLANELSKKIPKITYIGMGFENFVPWHEANLLINATSLGLKDKTLPPIPFKQLRKQTLISDIVYSANTPLLKKAKKLGFKTHPGWGMLLHQGLLAFEIWTGKKAPYTVMKKALLDALK